MKEKKQKEKSILKKSEKCLVIGLGTMLLGVFPLMACIPLAFKENNVMKNAGYDDFNEKYKQECFAEISEDYQNGKIKLEDFMTKSQNLEDYSVEKYIDEYASADVQKEINNIRTATEVLTNVGTTISSVGCAIASAGTAATVITLLKDRKALKKNNNTDKGVEV